MSDRESDIGRFYFDQFEATLGRTLEGVNLRVDRDELMVFDGQAFHDLAQAYDVRSLDRTATGLRFKATLDRYGDEKEEVKVPIEWDVRLRGGLDEFEPHRSSYEISDKLV